MLDDIPATPAQIARHLGISESTLKRYQRQGHAPRAVMLALFWETRWGRSAADTEAHNAAQFFGSHNAELKREIARFAGIIWRLETELGQLGNQPANLPIFKTY